MAAEIKFKFIPEQTEHPHPPVGCVILGYHTLDEFGIPLLSHDCVNFTEIEHEITRLKTQLDEVLAQAKKKLNENQQH